MHAISDWLNYCIFACFIAEPTHSHSLPKNRHYDQGEVQVHISSVHPPSLDMSVREIYMLRLLRVIFMPRLLKKNTNNIMEREKKKKLLCLL